MTTTINASTSAGLVQTADTSGSLALQTAGTTAVTIDTSQNVGLGVTPTAQYSGIKSLQVGSTTNLFDNGASSKFYHNAYTATSGDDKYLTTGYAQAYLMPSNGQHIWYTSASGTAGNNITFTQAMTLDSSGNLLVGTTSLGSAERVSISYNGAVQRGMEINNTNAGTQDVIYFRTTGTNVGRINTSTTATSYITSSDYRLKEDINPMTNALAKVSALKPVTYKWKLNGSDGQGFIAHELQAIVPDCVSGDKDAVDADGNPVYQGIDTSFLVATLTAAIQEAKALIDTQAETLSQQATLINALTARVETLEAK